MSILATDKKLISFGTDYSAGSGISIIDHTISVTGEFGKTYSAGPNIDIYDVSGQTTISSKDWSSEISDASAGAVTQSTSYFNEWINGQYTGDITNITNNLTALSGDLSSYYKKTETSSKEQISDAIQYVSAHAVGDVEVNNYVHNNSATIDEVNSAYKANSASYITAHQSLEGYATEYWVESKGYLTGVNIPESATWNETSNVVSSNSAQWSQGKTYEGVSPIVVNNDESKISADTWTLSAGDGISFTENSANKVTRIDVTAQGGNYIPYTATNNTFETFETNSGLEITTSDVDGGLKDNFITDSLIKLSYVYSPLSSSNISVLTTGSLSFETNSDSAYVDMQKIHTWDEVSAKVDTTALIPTIDSNTITYSSKPTEYPIYASDNDLKNVNSIQGKSNLAIVPNGVLQVPNVITATNGVLQVLNAITATNGYLTLQNGITAAPNDTLNVPGVITSNQGGLTANGLSANNDGLTANGLTADAKHSGFSANGISAGKSGPLFIEGQYESIYANNRAGFTFSSQNTAFGTAQLGTAQGNSVVQMSAPMFEARNISGAGFSIEASGAKGYDASGNVVWDTSNPQVKNIISYSDTKTAQGGLNGNIILTTQPSINASNLTSSPYVIMDANQVSYFASYGPSAQTPTVSLKPDSITFALPTGNSGRTTVGYNDVKQELSGSSWTLTGSIQKRELEYDANTSAITAINGSAIGGGTLTGDAQGAVDLVYSTSGNIITGTKRDYDFTAGNITGLTLGHITFNGAFQHIISEKPEMPYRSWYIGEGGFHLGPDFADGYNEQYARVYLERTGLSSMSGSRSDKKLIWRALLDTDVEGANNTITAIAGSALGGGSDIPISADEAIQYVQTNSGTIDDTITNVNTNSGAWGGSALPISAGEGIKVNLVDNTLVFSNDETVLYKFTGSDIIETSAYELSEAYTNFNRMRITFAYNDGYRICQEYDTKFDSNRIPAPIGTTPTNNGTIYCKIGSFTHNNEHTQISRIASYDIANFTGKNVANVVSIYSVVGINRIAGGN